MRRSPSLPTVLAVLSPVGILAAWWWWSTTNESFFFPPLPDIIEALREDWLFERVPTDLLATLERFAIGYALAVALGVTAGVLLGLRRGVARMVWPVVEFMRALPPPALLPFVIVAIGIDNQGKIFLIVLGSVWPVLLNSIDGVRGVDSPLLDTARSFGASPRQLLVTVRLPAALPQIVAGMRSSLAIALILTIISELVATREGVGFTILQDQRTFDMDGMWGGMLMLGILGIALNGCFSIAERRSLRWYHARARLLEQS